MIRQQVPQKNKRSSPKQGGRKRSKGSIVPGLMKEVSSGNQDLSPLLELILEHQLMENEFFQKQFGLQLDKKEEWIPRVMKFLLSFREQDNQSNLKLNTIVGCLSLKGVQVDTSEVGMKMIAGRPISIEHNIDWIGMKVLKDQIGIIMKRMRNCSEDQLGKMMESIFILEDFKDVKEKIISYLVENGKVVYVHREGIFPNLTPDYYEGDKSKINGAVHIMEWRNNLFPVSLSREYTQCLRKIYDLKIDSSLIVQVNWTFRLSKSYGGNLISSYESLIAKSIFKTASVTLRIAPAQVISLQQQQQISSNRMPESISKPLSVAKGNFQMKDEEIQKYQTPSKTDCLEEQRTFVNGFIERNIVEQFRKGSWKFMTIYEECQVLLLEGYIIGLVWNGELIRPDFSFISGKGMDHCMGCGQFPRGNHERCPVIMKPVLKN